MTKNLLKLILCLTLITSFACSKSQTMQCTEDNYIKSNFFNDNNNMTNKQRNIISVFTKDDWNKKYLNTNLLVPINFNNFKKSLKIISKKNFNKLDKKIFLKKDIFDHYLNDFK